VADASDATLADDLGCRRQACAAGGVSEAWVAAPAAHAARQYCAPLDGSYASEAVVPFGGQLTAATLPRLGIDTTAPGDKG